MRRALRRLAAAILALAVLLAAAAWAFLAHPEVFLTSRTVGAAVRYFGSAYAPRWSSLSFSAAATGPRRHRYAFAARGFCAADSRGLFSACFSRLEAAAVVSYSRRGARLERVDELIVAADSLAVDLRRRVPGASKLSPAALLATPVRALTVEVPAFTLRSQDSVLEGRLSAALVPGSPRPLKADAALVSRRAGAVRRAKAALTADSDLFKGGVPTYVDLRGRAAVDGVGRASAAVTARRAGGGYEVSGRVEVAASTGPLRLLRLAGCRGTAAARRGSALPTAAELSCRYEAAPAPPPPGSGSVGAVKSVAGRVRAKGALDGDRFEAEVAAESDPLKDWFVVTGGGELRFGGRVGRPLEALAYEAHAAVKAKFEDAVAFLKDTDYAVPAPIHVLSGPVALSLSSRGDPRADRLAVKYVLTADLSGGRQRLGARAAGGLTISRPREPERSFEHDGELLLKDVALELPRLGIGPAPKVVADRRIRTGEEEAAPSVSTASASRPRAAAFRSRLAVRTLKPVILFSNLAKDPVPVGLDLVVDSSPTAVGGAVSVREFHVELFRRNATVDHFNVGLSSGSTVASLEGLVLYKTPSVLIRILVLGTTERPRIELQSEPPLKRGDIIALLIFGKNPEELDPDQTASVSNTETAIESRAFGLASLYLFGSTPVEYVGYDSATRTASLKLRLPGGANLTLGSDFDQSRQLTVRKSLSRHWAIQSEISDQGRQNAAATTFLEWFNRY